MNREERTLTDTVAGGNVEMSVTAAATDAEIDRMVQGVSGFHAETLHRAVDVAADGWNVSWTAAVTRERDRCKPGHTRTHHAHWAAGGDLAPTAADQRWIPLTVTSETSAAEIADMVAEAVARRAADQHRVVEIEALRWRSRWRHELELFRHELGGQAPESVVAGESVAGPPCPMPGRMRTWTAPEGMWLQWVDRTHPFDLDHAQAVRVPVCATDTDADLEAAARRWLTGYGCPPEGTVAWVLPQLRAYRDRLAEDHRGDRARLSTLVLYVEDVEASAEWWTQALGIRWTRERHGGGPQHVSAVLGGVLLELYPASERRPVSHVRIELVVPDVFGDADQAQDGWPRRCVDPDGNVVVLQLR